MPESPPPWVSQMMQGLDIRLRQIESHLIDQNAKWQTMGISLQTQSERMSSIEQNVAELNGIKRKVETLENTIELLDNDVKHISRQVIEQQNKIQTQKALCEDARSDSAYSKFRVDDFFEQIEQLQCENEDMKSQLEKSDTAIVDLQCRSMRDNLIFVDIEEPE